MFAQQTLLHNMARIPDKFRFAQDFNPFPQAYTVHTPQYPAAGKCSLQLLGSKCLAGQIYNVVNVSTGPCCDLLHNKYIILHYQFKKLFDEILQL